jgi:cytochrome c oxidase subunit 2
LSAEEKGKRRPVVRTRNEFTDVWQVYLPIAAGVFLIVLLTLALFLWRYRQRRDPGREPGRKVEAHLAEGGYAVLLVLVVGFLVSLTYWHENRIDGYNDSTASAAAGDSVRVDVTAARWTWRFDYPGTGVTQVPPGPGRPTQVGVPAGTRIRFAGHSQDVLHDFWVPDVRFQRQVWPQHVEHWSLVFPPGRHLGVCAWFCGLYHESMRFVVIAVPRPRFDRWLASRRAQGSGA